MCLSWFIGWRWVRVENLSWRPDVGFCSLVVGLDSSVD